MADTRMLDVMYSHVVINQASRIQAVTGAVATEATEA
jgi:hypothetical protein